MKISFYSLSTIVDRAPLSYAALGLIHTLAPTASGGTEPPESTKVVAGEQAKQSIHASDPDTSAVIPKGFGRIVRDEAGNVMQIELAGEEESDYLADGNLEMMKGPEIVPEAKKKWVTRLGKQSDTEYQLENCDTIGSEYSSSSIRAPEVSYGPDSSWPFPLRALL